MSCKKGLPPALVLGGGVRYVGDVYSTNANNLTVPTIVPGVSLPASVVPASTVFDAALSYDLAMRYREWKGLSAALNVNNVFDRTYVSLCTGGGCRWALGTYGAGDVNLPVVKG